MSISTRPCGRSRRAGSPACSARAARASRRRLIALGLADEVALITADKPLGRPGVPALDAQARAALLDRSRYGRWKRWPTGRTRDRPSDLGLRPFGDDGTQPLPAPAPNNAPIMAAALGTLRDASKTRVFWMLFASFFICGASTNGLVQVHLIPMCLDYGIPQVQAASLLAAMGIFDFFGTIISGWLSDRYDNRYLLAWYYGLRGLSLVLLPFTNFSFYGLSLFAMFYGLDWIATVPPTVRLTAQRFGPGRANLVFGWIFAGHQLGAATAAFGAGLSRTLLASYLPAFFVAGALCIIASLLTLVISRPVKVAVAAAA